MFAICKWEERRRDKILFYRENLERSPFSRVVFSKRLATLLYLVAVIEACTILPATVSHNVSRVLFLYVAAILINDRHRVYCQLF